MYEYATESRGNVRFHADSEAEAWQRLRDWWNDGCEPWSEPIAWLVGVWSMGAWRPRGRGVTGPTGES